MKVFSVMTGRSFATLLVCLSLAAQTPAPPPVAGQPKAEPSKPEAAASGQQPFRSQVTEVIVPITVVDEKTGKFVSNLDSKDFKIFDEGKEQNIQFFTRERNQPVVIGFLMDMSNASRIHW